MQGSQKKKQGKYVASRYIFYDSIVSSNVQLPGVSFIFIIVFSLLSRNYISLERKHTILVNTSNRSIFIANLFISYLLH